MTTEDTFLAAIAADPADRVARGAFADWLDENGQPGPAAEQRVIASAVRDIGLPELLTDYDWSEVFGEGSGGNCDNATDACPPGSAVDTTPPTRADVAEVIATVNGENDESAWVGLFRLKDGRYLLASGSCDYTGWDCQAGNSLEVAATLADLLQYGLDAGQKARLGIQ